MVKNKSFGDAIECIKAGGAAWREGWNGKDQFITLGVNIRYKNRYGTEIIADHETLHSQAVVFHGTTGVQVGWLASQADMLSEDWVLSYGEN